ncbi:MAG: hypothetical protein LKF96_11685 [Treponema sp.]|jgi:hypothetical protein|nr:hypothetical protein [Treponema sp.]
MKTKRNGRKSSRSGYSLFIILLLAVFFCTPVSAQKSITAEKKETADFREYPAAGTSGRFILTIEQGTAWMETAFWFVFPVKLAPQYACWIETPDGRYVETIAVTAKAAGKKWVGAPAEGRPESLPVWYHASSSDTGTDAVTHATSRNETTEQTDSRQTSNGSYIVKFEVNHSFDYNDTWPKGLPSPDHRYSGVNGQPSLVYEGRITTGPEAATLQLIPAGRGAVDGKDGIMQPGTQGLTTALSIVSSVKIFWEPVR